MSWLIEVGCQNLGKQGVPTNQGTFSTPPQIMYPWNIIKLGNWFPRGKLFGKKPCILCLPRFFLKKGKKHHLVAKSFPPPGGETSYEGSACFFWAGFTLVLSWHCSQRQGVEKLIEFSTFFWLMYFLSDKTEKLCLQQARYFRRISTRTSHRATSLFSPKSMVILYCLPTILPRTKILDSYMFRFGRLPAPGRKKIPHS